MSKMLAALRRLEDKITAPEPAKASPSAPPVVKPHVAEPPPLEPQVAAAAMDQASVAPVAVESAPVAHAAPPTTVQEAPPIAPSVRTLPPSSPGPIVAVETSLEELERATRWLAEAEPAPLAPPAVEAAPPKTRAEKVAPAPAGTPPAATELETMARADLSAMPLGRQYKLLADNLVTQFPDRLPASLVLITPEPEMHGSLVALCTGMTLVRHDAGPVIVVDADLERKTLTTGLGLLDRPGLSEILAQQAAWDEAIVPTASAGVSFLPAGRRQLSAGAPPLALLARVQGELSQRWRFVLLDVGSAGSPLALPLARVCDGTYLVIRLGATPSGAAVSASADVQAAGARLLGAIVTNVPAWE